VDHGSAAFFLAEVPAVNDSGPEKEQITQLLSDWSAGDGGALEKLIPLVQPELHRLAQRYMNREREGHTLQATALINEAYLRLVDVTHPQWNGSAHFFAVAAQVMRRVMVDHARQRRRLKRGAGAVKVTLDETALVADSRADELLALDEALNGLAAVDSRLCQIVEMRYFGGLNNGEIAGVLKIHPSTVKRDWNVARAWLLTALSGEDMDAA
jgi:RNA polymerase sigma factor (TIGR02999 family)